MSSDARSSEDRARGVVAYLVAAYLVCRVRRRVGRRAAEIRRQPVSAGEMERARGLDGR